MRGVVTELYREASDYSDDRYRVRLGRRAFGDHIIG